MFRGLQGTGRLEAHHRAAQPESSKWEFETNSESSNLPNTEPAVEAKVNDDPTLAEDTIPEPFERIRATRTLRRKLWKRHILEDTTDELWCTAGYTYSTELAEKASRGKATRSFEDVVPEEYRQYSKVFSEVDSERLPEHRPYDHSIELKPDAPETIHSKVYPMPLNEQEELDRFLDENLQKGYIAPSKSPMASPVFFVK